MLWSHYSAAAGAEAMELAVSYTHLDVYKRQVLHPFPPKSRVKVYSFPRVSQTGKLYVRERGELAVQPLIFNSQMLALPISLVLAKIPSPEHAREHHNTIGLHKISSKE